MAPRLQRRVPCRFVSVHAVTREHNKVFHDPETREQQAIRLAWIGDGPPGSPHDLRGTAFRPRHLDRHSAQRGVPALTHRERCRR
jgi:hypothetical protein